MAERTYRIDFYTLFIDDNDRFSSVRDVFRALAARRRLYSRSILGSIREVRSIQPNAKQTTFDAVLAKLRSSDLPHRGRAGGEERQLDFAQDEGLIEKNHFRFLGKNSLLIWQSNRNANSPDQLCSLLSQFANATVGFGVISTGTAAQRLLAGEGTIKSYEFNLARPTNPALFPPGVLSEPVMNILAGVGGDRITIKSTVDARMRQRSTGFFAPVREALVGISRYTGTQSAKASIVKDDGEIEAIDLMTDRVQSSQSVELDGKYPNPGSMRDALARAYTERRDELEQFFGAEGNQLD